MARTKPISRQPPASLPIFPPSTMPIGSPLAVVAARLELESPRVEQRLQRDFGSGLIPNLDHEGEDEGDNFDGREEKN